MTYQATDLRKLPIYRKFKTYNNNKKIHQTTKCNKKESDSQI